MTAAFTWFHPFAGISSLDALKGCSIWNVTVVVFFLFLTHPICTLPEKFYRPPLGIARITSGLLIFPGREVKDPNPTPEPGSLPFSSWTLALGVIKYSPPPTAGTDALAFKTRTG